MIKKMSNNNLRTIITVFVTFIWLLPYDMSNKYFWLGQIATLVVSLYFVIKYFSRCQYKIRKENGIYIWIFIYGITTIIPSVMSMKAADILVQLIFTINILGMFAYFEISCKKFCRETCIGVTLIIVFYFIKDIQSFNLIGVRDIWYIPTYYTGGKFDVVYNIILALFAIYIVSFFKKKTTAKSLLYILSLVIAIFYCFQFDCMTGLLGIVAGVICFIVLSTIVKNISFTSSFMIFLGCGFIPFIIKAILSINFVQNIIINVLGRTTSLTGRLNIYTNIINVISHSILFGHGRSSTYSILVTNYNNMQNGLVQIVYLYGLLGLIALCKLVYEFLKSIMNYSNKKIVIAIFVAFAVCSISEITYGYTEYFYYLALAYSLCKYTDNSILSV